MSRFSQLGVSTYQPASVSALSVLLIVKMVGLLLGMVLRSLPVNVVESLGLKELVHLKKREFMV